LQPKYPSPAVEVANAVPVTENAEPTPDKVDVAGNETRKRKQDVDVTFALQLLKTGSMAVASVNTNSMLVFVEEGAVFDKRTWTPCMAPAWTVCA
jgi:hypothetical protein